MSTADQMRTWLHGTGGFTSAPDTAAAVVALERRYDLALPQDFRAYLLEAAPSPGSPEAWDDHHVLWWPSDRVKSVADECSFAITNPAVRRPERWLVFADYMIWCWAWAISCDEDEHRGRIIVLDGKDDAFVANSFADFVACHLSAPDGMALAGLTPDLEYEAKLRRRIARKRWIARLTRRCLMLVLAGAAITGGLYLLSRLSAQ